MNHSYSRSFIDKKKSIPILFYTKRYRGLFVELLGIQPLVDMIGLTLQTAFIEGNKTPLSLLMVSEPESAKTTTLNHFSDLEYIAYYDEITAKQMLDNFIPAVQMRGVKFLVIPDLINCVDKQRNTRDQFLALLKTGMDDTGIKRVSTAFKSMEVRKGEEGVRFGVVTAITGHNFKEIRKYITKTGLLSRFVPFSYKYPIDQVFKIFDLINKKKVKFDHVKIPVINNKMTKVTGDPRLYMELQGVAKEIGHEYQGYGIRAQINMQRLADASALMDHRSKVNHKDIEKVISLSRYMNYKFEMLT